MLYKIISFFMTVYVTVFSFFGIPAEKKGFELNTSRLEKNISSSQENRLSTGELTGAHIIVNQNGKRLIDNTYGLSSANGEALSHNATYRIASMTKPVTAVALLIEQDRGHLDIYDPVSDYIPEFSEMYVKQADGSLKKAENEIKLYMLVSHVSGLDDTYLSGANPVPLEKRTPETITALAAETPLVYEPGTQQAYNTAAFDVAARVVEITSGMEFEAYIKENIFDKLGMTDTTFEPSSDQWSKMVAIHGCENGKAYDIPMNEGCVFSNYPVTYHAAGAGLMSTAEDYSVFAEMLLNNGKAKDGTVVLSEKAVKQMRTPVVDDKVMSGNQKWGLGVRVITDNRYTLPKESFGWSGAYGSHFWIDPVNRVTAVYMKNSGYDGGAGCMTANEFEKDVMDSFSLKIIK